MTRGRCWEGENRETARRVSQGQCSVTTAQTAKSPASTGTRIPVRLVLGYLADGASVEDILSEGRFHASGPSAVSVANKYSRGRTQ